MQNQPVGEKRKRKPKKNQKKYEGLKHAGRTKRYTWSLPLGILPTPCIQKLLRSDNGNTVTFKPRKTYVTMDALQWERKRLK